MKYKNGFTLIEVAVAVAIIGVLATLTIVTFTNQQIKARDSARSSKATIIADSLEKYYDEHLEYPSERAMLNSFGSNTGDAVSSLLSITEKSVLVMPQAAAGTTNSIAPALGSGDVIAYVAQSTVGNDNCQNSIQGGCDEYTLSYKKESDGSTVTIDSLKKGRTNNPSTPLQPPAKPTIVASQSGTNLTATASVPTCSSTLGTSPRYAFRVQIGAGAWSAWSAWQTTNTYTQSASVNGTVYSFQVHERCESSTFMSDTSTDSDATSVTYYTMPTAPAAPTLSLSPAYGTVATSATATVSGGTCNYGTLQYLIDARTDDGTWSAGSWGTATTRTTNANQGDKYGFRATGRCVNGTQVATGSTSAESTVITGVAAPAAPSMSGSGPTWSWSPSACPAGSTPYYQYRFTYWDGVWELGTWTWTSATTATNGAATAQGITYGIDVQEYCYSGYINGAYSASGGGATMVVPVVHVSTQYAALALLSGAYPSIKLKSFSGPCASGLDRYVAIAADYGNTNTYTYRILVNQSTGISYPAGSFAPAPDGVIYNITSAAVGSGSYVEFDIRSHCQNSLTGYGTDSGGYSTAKSLYDYGNLHLITSTQYSNSCVPDSANMYCAAGYDSSGTKNTTNSGALACNLKTSSNTYINDTTTKWSARSSLGSTSNNVCWNT